MPLQKSSRFAIRITGMDGDLYLREGDEPGKGPLAVFPSMASALAMIEKLRPGFEPTDCPAVVGIEHVPESER